MKNLLLFVTAGLSLLAVNTRAQTVPTPDHVLIVMLENRDYGNIIGNQNAPFINSLASDPANAVFTESYALTHPSQPNYLMLYSGDNQGITNDNNITNSPFSTGNLGASLLAAGLTFTGYSEGLPQTGALDFYYANYARKHAPWVNWQGSGTNRVPASVNQPFGNFPTAYSTLPTISFVIPGLDHDMHDPTNNPAVAIANGDAWVASNLANYIIWAKTHNSLFILTFDENDGTSGNRITTIFSGAMVQGGTYTNHIDHYTLLRTLEDMYGLPHSGNSANRSPITNCWINMTTGGEQLNNPGSKVAVGPIPARENFTISILSPIEDKATVTVYDMNGRLVKEEKIDIEIGKNSSKIDAVDMSAGVYIVKIKSTEIDFVKKIILE